MELACLYINPLTAFCFLDIIKKHKANAIIHTAGGSAVGRILTKLCLLNNINIINTVRR